LDALDYAPSLIEPIPNIIITEGKYDWYTFNYMNEIILKNERINFYPGGGKDSLWDIIRLYLSWGQNFIVILDGDAGGIKSKNLYKKEFDPFLENKIFTLKDIFHKDYCLEDLITYEDKKSIIFSRHTPESYNAISNTKSKVKELLNWSLNMLAFDREYIELSETTKDNFKELMSFINSKII